MRQRDARAASPRRAYVECRYVGRDGRRHGVRSRHVRLHHLELRRRCKCPEVCSALLVQAMLRDVRLQRKALRLQIIKR